MKAAWRPTTCTSTTWLLSGIVSTSSSAPAGASGKGVLSRCTPPTKVDVERPSLPFDADDDWLVDSDMLRHACIHTETPSPDTAWPGEDAWTFRHALTDAVWVLVSPTTLVSTRKLEPVNCTV